MSSEKTRERTALSRRRIVREALRIVDAEGLRSLSMRRLASALGVVPNALYYHLPNKAALYDGIVEAIMSEIDVSADRPDASFEQRLKHAARAYRDVLVAHPNALPVVAAGAPRTPASLRPVETMLRILRDGGLDPAQALVAVDVVAALVQGAASMQVSALANASGECPPSRDEMLAALSPAEFPCLFEAAAAGPPPGLEQEFETGLDALVRGLADRGA